MPTGLAVGVRRRPDERRVAGREAVDFSRENDGFLLNLILSSYPNSMVCFFENDVACFFSLDSVILVTPFWTNNTGPFFPHHSDRSSADRHIEFYKNHS